MLQSILQMLAFVVTFLVFYRLLSVYLQHIATGSSRPLLVDILHYYILAIVVTVSIVRSVLYNIVLAQNVNQGFSTFTLTYLNISASQEIIIWMAALELFACITYVLVKSGDLSISRRVCVPFSIQICACSLTDYCRRRRTDWLFSFSVLCSFSSSISFMRLFPFL